MSPTLVRSPQASKATVEAGGDKGPQVESTVNDLLGRVRLVLALVKCCL